MTSPTECRKTSLALCVLLWCAFSTAAAAEPGASKASPAPKARAAEPAKAKAPARPVRKAVATPVAPAPLDETELAVADKVYVGRIPCELGQTVRLEADTHAPGHFHLHTRDQVYHLRPVASATGAVRLEDAAKGAVWIQLGNKSMLMNQKLGRRLADDCMAPVQQAAAEHLKDNPAPNLLDLAQKPR
jgi:hypothetical protein